MHCMRIYTSAIRKCGARCWCCVCVCVCAVAVVGVLLLLLSRLLLVRPRAHHSQCLFSPVVRAFACAIRAHNCYLRCFTSWNCFGCCCCCCLFCIVSFSFVLFFCLAVFIYFTRAIERRSLSRRFHTHTHNKTHFIFVSIDLSKCKWQWREALFSVLIFQFVQLQIILISLSHCSESSRSGCTILLGR